MEEPKRSKCNAQPCRALRVRRNANVCGTKWLRRAAAPQSPIQTTMADAAVPHPKLEIARPGWCWWLVQSNKVQHVAPQLIPLPRSYRCRTEAQANGVLARIKNSRRAPYSPRAPTQRATLQPDQPGLLQARAHREELRMELAASKQHKQ